MIKKSSYKSKEDAMADYYRLLDIVSITGVKTTNGSKYDYIISRKAEEIYKIAIHWENE